jgi:hypothetical protein
MTIVINLRSIIEFSRPIFVSIDHLEKSQYEYFRSFAHFNRKNSVEYIISSGDRILVCHATLVNLLNSLNNNFFVHFHSMFMLL